MSETYRFMVGDFHCLAVSDGSYSYSPAALFANAPADKLRSELDLYGITTPLVMTPYTFLLVDTGQWRILVDLGAGSLAPTTGRLPINLHDAGYGSDEIDCILITHAHPDHVGGALDAAGNLRFPRSAYFVRRREWDYWFSDEAANVTWERHDFTSIARKNLSPMESRLTLIDCEKEILPGVAMLDACGQGGACGTMHHGSGEEYSP